MVPSRLTSQILAPREKLEEAIGTGPGGFGAGGRADPTAWGAGSSGAGPPGVHVPPVGGGALGEGAVAVGLGKPHGQAGNHSAKSIGQDLAEKGGDVRLTWSLLFHTHSLACFESLFEWLFLWIRDKGGWQGRLSAVPMRSVPDFSGHQLATALYALARLDTHLEPLLEALHLELQRRQKAMGPGGTRAESGPLGWEAFG